MVLKVAVTGGAGQIAYSLIPRIANGLVFGPETKVDLRLLDIPMAEKALMGVAMEIQDSAFDLLDNVTGTTAPSIAFKDVDVAILLGGFPRKAGMERSDLIGMNADIMRITGQALEMWASKDVKVVVVANPANTNCKLLMDKCPSIPKENFSAMTRLDHDRLAGLLVEKINAKLGGTSVKTSSLRNICIFGNHSATQYPFTAVGEVLLDGKWTSIKDVIADDAWLANELVPKVQVRGAAVIKARGLSSAMSAAAAVSNHLKDLFFGTKDGVYTSMAILSDGNPYGVPEGLMYSFPVTVKNGKVTIVPGLPVDQAKMDANIKELQSEYKVANDLVVVDSCASLGIDKQFGISNPKTIYKNLSYPEIMIHEVKNNEGEFTDNGTYSIKTGIFTGRSPKDKYFVKQQPSENLLDFGKINQPTSVDTWKDNYKLCVDYFNTLDQIYVFEGYCGTNENSRKKVRFLTKMAWQHHFISNMFVKPKSKKELENFEPDFTVINACEVTDPKWKEHGLNSEVFVIFNLEEKCAIVGGTYYGGENKKGIFSLMHYSLPQEGIMSMHCSANKGPAGDTALFFGLSGTGKTTLSADPSRFLIGDDEHGWDDEGIFNFEGGCYAKTIDLSEENEPDIYRAIKPDALLENVVIKEDGKPDYYDTSITKNGRVSYPIYHIPNYEKSSKGGHPNNCIFLAADAFGVLPPVARLSPEQAMYHFLSGYTAKVAGTERGITEPVPDFSAGFGAAFLTLHPSKYGDLLLQKVKKHGTKVYLVNTGWTGGPYGVGSRMKIKETRACISAILDGSIEKCSFETDPVFQFEIPTELAGVRTEVLNARNTWADKDAFDAQRQKLAGMFIENYKKYQVEGMTDYSKYGPVAQAMMG